VLFVGVEASLGSIGEAGIEEKIYPHNGCFTTLTSLILIGLCFALSETHYSHAP